MSRSGYDTEIEDHLQYGRYRGRVASAIRGKRGQKMLRDLLAALDAMPQKRLANGFFETPAGDVCALGALGRARGVDISTLDEDDHEALAATFDIAECLAAEVMFMNDEYPSTDTKPIKVEVCGPMRPYFPEWGRHERTIYVPDEDAPRRRWAFVRQWVVEQLVEDKA